MAKAISTTHNIDMANYDFNQHIEGRGSDEIVCENDKTRNGNRETRKRKYVYIESSDSSSDSSSSGNETSES